MIAELTHSAQSDDLWKFLDAIYQSKVPDPGGSLQIPFGQDGVKVNIILNPISNRFTVRVVPS